MSNIINGIHVTGTTKGDTNPLTYQLDITIPSTINGTAIDYNDHAIKYIAGIGGGTVAYVFTSENNLVIHGDPGVKFELKNYSKMFTKPFVINGKRVIALNSTTGKTCNLYQDENIMSDNKQMYYMTGRVHPSDPNANEYIQTETFPTINNMVNVVTWTPTVYTGWAGNIMNKWHSKLDAGQRVTWIYGTNDGTHYVNVTKVNDTIKAIKDKGFRVAAAYHRVKDPSGTKDHYYEDDAFPMYFFTTARQWWELAGGKLRIIPKPPFKDAPFGYVDAQSLSDSQAYLYLFRSYLMHLCVMFDPTYTEGNEINVGSLGYGFKDGNEGARTISNIYIDPHPLGMTFCYANEVIYCLLFRNSWGYGEPGLPANNFPGRDAIWHATQWNTTNCIVISSGSRARGWNGPTFGIKKY